MLWIAAKEQGDVADALDEFSIAMFIQFYNRRITGLPVCNADSHFDQLMS